ncbi:hypothetical protein PP753_gp06 [Dinoroseobacter phage vB_DshP-R7L]|uniref:Uncharacterized protein n=1 Tax=Dinoroseobacter phage vB_DshP-R7L TaxID=2873349 RepID=A0AAE9BMC8_9CAUD|nr:hypothetical protein PP753_gp06 [Dinoroseobacter phage vB_DshP-R7L]UAT28845.1 hypothetical protein R7L_gp6 [Dinoroseobacter phage vB_DshP-R7L]
MSQPQLLAEEIHKAAADVENCRARLDTETERYEQASKNRTMAINDLNNAQKVFDSLVKKLRENNKQGTDWNLHPAER